MPISWKSKLNLVAVLSTAISVNASALKVDELTTELTHPWGMTFLPESTIVITERPGNIRLFDEKNGLSAPLKNVPGVMNFGQGGITADPKFAENNKIYFCYSKPGEGGSSTGVSSAVLKGDSLTEVKTIFTQYPLVDNGFHFGCRLVFDADGHLFVSLGERYAHMKEAQNLDCQNGTAKTPLRTAAFFMGKSALSMSHLPVRIVRHRRAPE